MDKRQSASVTVYAALSFMMIMALMLALLESAHQNAGRAYLSGLTGAALESLFADYYAPLYKEYHVFGLYDYCTGTRKDLSGLSEVMESYMDFSLDNGNDGKRLQLFGAKLSENLLMNAEYLTDNGCGRLIDEAIAYERLKSLGDAAGALLGRAGAIGRQKQNCRLVGKKLETEEELSELEYSVVKLMTRIDGITFDRTGVTYDSGGGIMTEDYFVKQLCPAGFTTPYLRIANDRLCGAIYRKCCDIGGMIENIRSSGEGRSRSLDMVRRLEGELRLLSGEADRQTELLRRQREQLEQAAEKPEPSKKPKASGKNEASEGGKDDIAGTAGQEYEAAKKAVRETENRIDGLRREEAAVQARLESSREELSKYRLRFSSSCDRLRKLHGGADRAITEALDIIAEIRAKQPGLRQSVREFEQLLKAEEETGAAQERELFDELGGTLVQMKRYTGMSGSVICGVDLELMESTLLTDRSVLAGAGPVLAQAENTAESDYPRLRALLRELEKLYGGYSFEGLSFDYGDIRLDTTDDGVSGAVEKLASDGMLTILFGKNAAICDNELTEPSLPSGEDGDITGSAPENIMERRKSSAQIQSVTDSSLWDILGAAAGKVMLARYVQEHFLNLSMLREISGEDASGEAASQRFAGHVLSYEQEYILYGSRYDKINLERTALSLLLLRFAGSLVYCLADSSVTRQAAAFAASVVGFAGLPFLVGLVKYAVLIVWAVIQALVEVSAVMNGRRIALFTNSRLFCVSLREIPSMLSTRIYEKAVKLPEDKNAPAYEDYLLILLIVQTSGTQAKRTADLIQENIRDKYDSGFRLDNCLAAVSSVSVYKLPSRFFNGILPGPAAYRTEKSIAY